MKDAGKQAPNLFTPEAWPQPAARRNAPQTSHAAARSMQASASQIASRIYDHLKASGPMTCAQCQIDLEMNHQTCSPRFTELRQKGLIYDTGLKRPTPSGRKAIVWDITKGMSGPQTTTPAKETHR